VQAGRSWVAIEQHGNTGVATAQADNDADLVSQIWATNRSKFVNLKAGADRDSICLPVHDLAPKAFIRREILDDLCFRIISWPAEIGFVTATGDVRSGVPFRLGTRTCYRS
jgi:hypothetical protein